MRYKMAAARANWDTAGERGEASRYDIKRPKTRKSARRRTHDVDRVAARYGWVIQEVETLSLGGAELRRCEGADTRRKDDEGNGVCRSQSIHNNEAWATTLRASDWCASDIQLRDGWPRRCCRYRSSLALLPSCSTSCRRRRSCCCLCHRPLPPLLRAAQQPLAPRKHREGDRRYDCVWCHGCQGDGDRAQSERRAEDALQLVDARAEVVQERERRDLGEGDAAAVTAAAPCGGLTRKDGGEIRQRCDRLRQRRVRWAAQQIARLQTHLEEGQKDK